MNKRILLSFFLALAFTFIGQAQHHFACGTVGHEAKAVSDRLLRNRAAFRSGFIRSRSTIYLPIKFHIIARTNGTGGVEEDRVYDQLCEINKDFEDTGIQFYISDGTFSYINNDVVYSNHSSGAGSLFMNAAKANDAINIFMPNDAGNGSGTPGVVLGYYTSQQDWIVVARAEVGSTRHTMTHEIGHFLSLPHPFNGWDIEFYDEAVHGNPVGPLSPSGIPNEKVDGSNCETAGDFTCDTAPNYGFGFGWQDCNYDAGTMDPDGVVIDTDESLAMGYFFQCPRSSYYFTPTQATDMQADIAMSDRNYINLGITPNTTEITETTNLIAPEQGEIVSFNAVQLVWEAVSGADFYQLEYDNTPQFGSGATTQIVYGNSIVLELEANTSYFWRVRPLNAYRTCANTSQFRAFRTDATTSTQELDFVSQWLVAPNPVNTGNSVSVNLEAKKAFDTNLRLLNVTGQLVQDFGRRRMEIGSNQFVLDLQALPKGMYLLSLITDEGISSRRLIVQ
ncbi:MAG: zinc-dependent metalloprotease [Bacteroidota bacterium]